MPVKKQEFKPLVIENLVHRYAHKLILDDIQLTLEPGEFLSVLGASGCGKTTLLRSIAGLVEPTEGVIRIADQLVFSQGKTRIATEQRQIGFVFQDYALFPYQTVGENIAFGLYHKRHWSKQAIQQRVDELLALIGMSELTDRLPSELSGGQQQRVAIARALAPKPSLLLLDEPFANIDVTLRHYLSEALQALVASQGVSVILVTHDFNEAFALADRVAVLAATAHGARIVQCDCPEQVYTYPATATVAKLGGTVSLLPAEANGDSASTCLATVKLHPARQGACQLVLRPESMRFTADATGNATVIARSFRGSSYRLLCQLPTKDRLYVDVPLTQPIPQLGTIGQLHLPEVNWSVR